MGSSCCTIHLGGVGLVLWFLFKLLGVEIARFDSLLPACIGGGTILGEAMWLGASNFISRQARVLFPMKFYHGLRGP